MEIKLKNTYKGTRIIFAETAKRKRTILNQMIEILESYGYQEMMIPAIQLSEIFDKKVIGQIEELKKKLEINL